MDVHLSTFGGQNCLKRPLGRFYLLFADPAPLLQCGHHMRKEAPYDRRQIPNAFVAEGYLQYVRRGDAEVTHRRIPRRQRQMRCT